LSHLNLFARPGFKADNRGGRRPNLLLSNLNGKASSTQRDKSGPSFYVDFY
jgi:hypothetical protein